MDKPNETLDWKKVFKRILNGPEQCNEEECFRESIQKANSDADLKSEGKELQGNFSSNSFFSKNSSNEISGDSGNKSSSLHEWKLGKTTDQKLDVNITQHVKNSTKQKYCSKNEKNNQVPEWNTVFKSILGTSTSVPALGNQKITFDTIQKPENLQKHDFSVNSRPISREKFYKVPKSKDPEEEKVTEILALSRMFKFDCHYNLNDFDGDGVDIFKFDKKSFPQSFVKSSSKAEFTDKTLNHESDSEVFVPLKGFVAKFKPYTTADLIASPSVPFIEPAWDDELLI